MLDIDTHPGQSTNARHPHHIFTALAWAGVIVLVIAVYLYQQGYLSTFTGVASKSTKSVTASNAGYILASYSYVGAQDRTRVINATTGEVTRASNLSFNQSASSDGRYIIGSDATGDILSYDTTTGKSDTIVTGVTGTPYGPRLSSDTIHLVFNTTTSTDFKTFYKPSAWNIYMVTRGGQPGVVAHGLYPHWSPDGKSILYLGDNGLHEYMLASSSDAVVFKLSAQATRAMTLDISKNGSKLAWTDPTNHQLMIADITSWHPLTAHVEKVLPITALFPLFSPDGTRVAFENVATSTSSGANTTISAITISTGAITTITHLISFDQKTFGMSDWVEHL